MDMFKIREGVTYKSYINNNKKRQRDLQSTAGL